MTHPSTVGVVERQSRDEILPWTINQDRFNLQKHKSTINLYYHFNLRLLSPKTFPSFFSAFDRNKKIFRKKHTVSAGTLCYALVSPPESGCESVDGFLTAQTRHDFWIRRKKKPSNVARRAEPLISDYCQAEGQREERHPGVSPSLSKHSHIQRCTGDTQAQHSFIQCLLKYTQTQLSRPSWALKNPATTRRQ